MKKSLGTMFAAMLVLFAMILPAAAGGAVQIKVAPNTFILSSTGECITVHTNIAFSEAGSSFELNGVAAYSVFSDSRGYLVTKFDRVGIFATVAPPEAVLIFTGSLLDGTPIEASATVRVSE